MNKLGDTVRVYKKPTVDFSEEANLKILHMVLAGVSPPEEYDLVVLDTQEKVDSYNAGVVK